MEMKAQQAVIEQLQFFADSASDFEALALQNDENSGFQHNFSYKRRLPHGAKLSSLQFLRDRTQGLFQLHALTFIDTSNLNWRLYCLLQQNDQKQWKIEGCSGTVTKLAVSGRSRTYPHITLYGDNDPYFYAGGIVEDAGYPRVGHVYLLSSENLLAEDIISNRTEERNPVLFISEKPCFGPLQVKYFTSGGKHIDTQNISLAHVLKN